jgi:hypothetical protein
MLPEFRGARHCASRTRKLFSPDEDARLLSLVGDAQSPHWEQISQSMPGRNSRQCRERWSNYVNPAIRTDPWTAAEDDLLIQKVNEMGHFWSSMSSCFNGRSESDIKNRWYSHLQAECAENPFTRRWERAARDAQGWPAKRRKRNRQRTAPSQAAQKLVGDRAPSRQCDFWDSGILERAFEEYDFDYWRAKNETPHPYLICEGLGGYTS